MWRRSTTSLIYLIYLIQTTESNSFHRIYNIQRQYHSSSSNVPATFTFLQTTTTTTRTKKEDTIQKTSQGEEEEEELNNNKNCQPKMVVLQFEGNGIFSAPSLPMPTDGKCVHEFFDMEENIVSWLRGRNNIVERIHYEKQMMMTTMMQKKNLMSNWKRETEFWGLSSPEEDHDKVYKVSSPGLRLPGLSILSVQSIGVKTIPQSSSSSSSSTSLAQYQCTSITSETIAEGARPLVWMYNVLTGSEKKRKEGDKLKEEDPKSDEVVTGSQTSRTFVHILALPSEEEAGKVDLMAKVNLLVEVQCPPVLMKLLPVSKEKAEEQVSKALERLIKDEVPPSLDHLRDCYMSWQSI